MKYIKAKFPNSSRSYTYRIEDDVQPGDTVVNAKGVKLIVVNDGVDEAWINAYGAGRIAEVKKYIESKNFKESEEK